METGCPLSLIKRRPDGTYGGIDVDHDTVSDAGRRRGAEAADLHDPIGAGIGHDHGYLAAAYIKRYQ